MHAKDVMIGSVVCINVGDSIFDAAELLLGARVTPSRSSTTRGRSSAS